MDENFLHYLWQYGLFNTRQLMTTEGDELVLIHRGFHNRDSGADFSLAKIRIGETLWAGNVEIHINSSDWYLHGHQHDASHHNTILHVVWKDDGKGPADLPCLALQGLVPYSVLHRYERLRGGRRWVACEDFKIELNSPEALNWVERMAIERLEVKHQLVHRMVEEATGDTEYTLHRLIFRAFGFKVNAQPMEQLLQALGMRLLGKIYQNPMARAAVFHGLAGMLSSNFSDEYPKALKSEFDYQSRKHQLRPILLQWKTGKIRPANFPALRVAQLSAMPNLGPGLLAKVCEAQNINQLRQILQSDVHDYWHAHYDFDKKGRQQVRKMSDAGIDLLIINAVVPVLFYLGRQNNNALLMDRALELLTTLAPENNRITRQWEACGIKAENALHSQGLIHLLQEYCNPLRCLNCGIANNILKQDV